LKGVIERTVSMEEFRKPRNGRDANGGTKGGTASLSQDSRVPLLLLSIEEKGSYDSRLRGRLDELSLDETGAEEIYRTLWRMEREGMVVCNRDGSGFKILRRWYEITEPGRTYLKSSVSSQGRHQENIGQFLKTSVNGSIQGTTE
jgi:DNA-binding PadR family transcriptional regulator